MGMVADFGPRVRDHGLSAAAEEAFQPRYETLEEVIAGVRRCARAVSFASFSCVDALDTRAIRRVLVFRVLPAVHAVKCLWLPVYLTLQLVQSCAFFFRRVLVEPF